MDDRSSRVRPPTDNDKPSHLGQIPDRQKPTSLAQIDQSISLLATKKGKWASFPIRDRIRLLDVITAAFAPISDAWVHLSLVAKGALEDAYAAGWEWASGPMPILRYLRALKRTLEAIERTGSPPIPNAPIARPNGQVSVRVYPADMYESLTTPGTTVEVWMEPGLSIDDVLNNQATPSFPSGQAGKVCLVLGAGNVSAGPLNDSLFKLFVENCVVILKMNPVNDYLGPLIEHALHPLISEGYLQVVYGGASEGAYISNHPDIDCIHMMGSASTYEAIQFGSGPEAQRRKAEHRSVYAKPMTAELGNVAPVIIVPGPWSEQDLKYQAQQLASNLCDSGSYSCSRGRVIIQHSDWSLRHHLIDALHMALADVPARTAYYPGASELYDRFISAHPEVRPPTSSKDGTLPWTVIADVDPMNQSEICFTTESFCPVIAETALESPSVQEFVNEAVNFANHQLWGTLSALVIVHPKSLRDPDLFNAIERAIDQLQYGVIAVNCLPGLAWGMAVPPWGSYPGNMPWDIQSGTGFVHNAYMFSHPQKIVMRAPFRTWPTPPWFPSIGHQMADICRRVAAYEAKPSFGRMLSIVLTALR